MGSKKIIAMATMIGNNKPFFSHWYQFSDLLSDSTFKNKLIKHNYFVDVII